MGRQLLLVAVVMLGGCYQSVDPGEITDADADTWWDSRPDTRPDPVDPPYEPPVDTRPDPVPDPWHDPYPDPGPDGCTGYMGGICNLVEQCGCSPGFACDLAVDPECTLFEDCVAASGTREVEAECDAAGQCRPGTVCFSRTGETVGHCFEWCVTSSDCSIVGRECNVSVSFSLPAPCSGTAGASPYQVCSQDCPEGEACGLPDANTCIEGAACRWDPNCDILWCVEAGSLEPGDDCSDSGNHCRVGSGCYTTDGGVMFLCYEYCNTDAPACTTGTCTVVGSTAYPNLGVCQ